MTRRQLTSGPETPEAPPEARVSPRMRFDLISLFPEFFAPWQSLGVCGRAVTERRVSVRHWNPRQFVFDVHQTIDDRPYGGGPGMVMMAPPLADCVAAIRNNLREEGCSAGPVILMSPAGARLTQGWIESQVAQFPQVVPANAASDSAPPAALSPKTITQQFTLVCGRYEGIDQRFIDRYVDLEVSLGDFVLSGGEIAALALMDALVRRLPGVLNDALSSIHESFMRPQLDHPHFTRPEVFEGTPVPSVLLSGHHGKIADWRAQEAYKLTSTRRPDLLERGKRQE